MMLHKDIFTKKKKLVYEQRFMSCKFCKAKGHNFSMCLARPTVPFTDERSPWADALLGSPPIDVSIYGDLSKLAARQKLLSMGEELNMGNPLRNSRSPRDAIRSKLGLWKAIGATKSVLSWHWYGLVLRFHHTPAHLDFQKAALDPEEQAYCDVVADKYLATGKYWKPPPGYPALLSPQMVQHSVRDDGTAKMRGCDNLIYLNAHLPTHSHRMETLKKSIPLIVQQFDMLYTHDYADAYRSVYMHPSSWKWLCLRVGDRILGSKVLPFGLKPATFWFTKMNRPVLAFFRAILLKLLNYLDDWVNAASPRKIAEAFFITSDILSALGWIINMEKQHNPATTVKALGFLINAVSCEFENLPHKLIKLKAMCVHMHEEIRLGNPVTNQTLARLLGYAISCKLAVPIISIFTRPLYKVLSTEKVDQLKPVVFGPLALLALQELSPAMSRHANAPFADIAPVATVLVDTSVSATGGVFMSCLSKEDWKCTIPLPNELIGTSSTLRELYGALVVLQAVLPLLSKQAARDMSLPRHKTRLYLRLVIDSAASIFCLLKPGSRSRDLNGVVKLIYELTTSWNVFLVPEWSARELLQMVDDLSKKWENLPGLSEQALLNILRKFHGIPVVMPPPNKIGTMIHRAVRTVVVVHPVWPSQNWWPLLSERRVASLDLGDFSNTFDETNETQPEWCFQASLIPHAN
jgi:hypothetical protein